MQISFRKVGICGLAVAVPHQRRTTADLAAIYGEADAQRIARGVGIASRRVATRGVGMSDLFEAAAKPLLERAGTVREKIGAVIAVTQSPDYLLPATACVLQHRLNLPTSIAAFDVGMGCSGYVYGLWLAYNIAAHAGCYVLLCVGDTISRMLWPEDRGTFPLFGDAGSATLVGPATEDLGAWFELGTDGGGAGHLIVRNVGFRRLADADFEPEGARPRLEMNGPEVFAFTLREVPPLIERVLSSAGWTLDDCDGVIFHQANAFMLEHLRAKIGVPADKFLNHISEFGNTSSASLPLEMVAGMGEQLRERRCRLLLAGFGVGLSWGAAALTVGPIEVCPLIEVPS